MPADRATARRRPRTAATVASWLPLLLLALLAAGTWQLARRSGDGPAAPARAVSADRPDYTMRGFAASRFDATGRQVGHIEGSTLRHFTLPDRIEVDEARMNAVDAEGRRSEAVARRGMARSDGSIVELQGGAQLRLAADDGRTVVVASEFLQARRDLQTVQSDRPVEITDGSSRLQASGMEYTQRRQVLQLKGPVHAVFEPRRARNR